MASARDARRGGGGGGVWSLFRSKYLYLYAFGSFSNGLFISLRGPIIPELARRVGREPAALGTYLGLGGVSGGVFALPTGYFLDRVDAHAVFITGVVTRALSVGVMPWCDALWQGNVLSVVQGATLPMIGVSIRLCLTRRFGAAKCAPALNFTMGAFGLASILAPLLYAGLSELYPSRGFELTFLVAGIVYLALAAAVASTKAPKEIDDDDDEDEEDLEEEEEEIEKYEEEDGDGDEELASPTRMRSPVRRRLLLSDEAVAAVEAPPPPPPPPRRVAATSVLLPMVLYMSFAVSLEVTYGSWIYTLSQDEDGLGDGAAAALTSSLWAWFTLTRFALSLLNASPLRVILASHLVALAALGWLATWWSHAAPWSTLNPNDNNPKRGGGVVLWATTALVGVGCAGMFPNGIAHARTFFPLTGFSQSLFELGAATGAGVGPYVGAALYARTGKGGVVPASCAAAGVAALAALACATAANARERRRERGGTGTVVAKADDGEGLAEPLLGVGGGRDGGEEDA